MSDKEIIIACPCCETKLWLDRETYGILKYENPLKAKKSFDVMISKYKEEKSNCKYYMFRGD